MQFRDLELFCEIAARRSFSKGAKACNLSQPVASESMRALEERLGTELFNRATRPLELTPAGYVFLDGTRALLDGFRCLEDRVRQLDNQVAGPVRVAAIYSVGLLQMDTYVKEFERRYPDAALELCYLRPNEVVDRVQADDADLGLMSFPPRRSDLECIAWQEQPMAVIVSPQHRLANRKSMRASELEGEGLVTFTSDLQIRAELMKWLRQARIHVDVVHEFDNIENIKRAVEVGSGLALLPVPSVRRELEMGSLKVITLEDVRWTRPLTIVHRRHKPLTTPVLKFLELLHEQPESFAPLQSASATTSLLNGHGPVLSGEDSPPAAAHGSTASPGGAADTPTAGAGPPVTNGSHVTSGPDVPPGPHLPPGSHRHPPEPHVSGSEDSSGSEHPSRSEHLVEDLRRKMRTKPR